MEPEPLESPQRVYANFAAGHGSVFDLALDFGYLSPQSEAPEPLVRVLMSWPHAKALTAIMNAQISAYEEQMGDIPLPTPDGAAQSQGSPDD